MKTGTNLIAISNNLLLIAPEGNLGFGIGK